MMIYRFFYYSIIGFFLTGCGNILLNQEVIELEEFNPKINHSVSLRSLTNDGFLIDYTKTFFGKADSTYKCQKVLKKERYNLTIGNSGNIIEQTLNPGFNYSDYEFIDGVPSKVTKNDFASSVVFLTFFDFDEKQTRSYKTSLLSYLPSNFAVIESVKLIYVSDYEYYFYGILKGGRGQTLFVAKVSKGDVIDFAFSESAYQINDIYSPKLLPNGDVYFITSINEEFGFPNQKWLVKYNDFKKKLTFEFKLADLKGDFGPSTIITYKDGELIIFPELFSQNNTKLTAYSFSRINNSMAEKVIQISDQGNSSDIKVFETKLGQYIGYTNLKNELIISKLNGNFSLTPTFKVKSIELSRLITVNNNDRVYEFDPAKQYGDAVETKIRVHTGLGTYRDLVLFRGIGYRDTCN